VGSYAIQLAADRGLKVIATARPGAAWDFVSGLGAATVVDYTGDLTAQVRAVCPAGVDSAIHLAGSRQAVADLVTPGGRLAFVVSGDPAEVIRTGLTVVPVMGTASRESLSTLAALITEGRLRVPITRSFTLEQVPEALAAHPGHLGKLAVAVPG
jgi:NADPH:quinone reductase-like Zn-dependent oxidoreductase